MKKNFFLEKNVEKNFFLQKNFLRKKKFSLEEFKIGAHAKFQHRRCRGSKVTADTKCWKIKMLTFLYRIKENPTKLGKLIYDVPYHLKRRLNYLITSGLSIEFDFMVKNAL